MVFRRKPISDEEVDGELMGLKKGLIRWYDDGTKWSKSDVEGMINSIFIKRHLSINDPRVQAKLQEWEEAGYIKLHRTRKLYLEVLVPFDYVSPWDSENQE